MINDLFSKMVLPIINNSKQVLVKITDRFNVNVESKRHVRHEKHALELKKLGRLCSLPLLSFCLHLNIL